MKRILMVLAMTLGVGSAVAVDVIELPIVSQAAPEAVLVSTSTYTNVTSTMTRAIELSSVLLDNPTDNTAVMHGHVGNCTSTAVSTVTVKGPIEIAPSTNGGYISLANDRCLWMVSHAASAEYLTVQGVQQKR